MITQQKTQKWTSIGKGRWESNGSFQWQSTGKVTILWNMPPKSEIPVENTTEDPQWFLRCRFLVCNNLLLSLLLLLLWLLLLLLLLWLYYYDYILIITITICLARNLFAHGGGLHWKSPGTSPYGQFSKFHVCFCGPDPGNLKFETVRTNQQHICF